MLPSSGLVQKTDEVGQNYSTYDVIHKKYKTQNQKNFFHCGLEDLQSLLRLQTAL